LSLAKASVRGSAPNRVEVGRVGRQVEQPGASRFDGGADRWAPVRGQVIHDHDIAAMQTGYQHLFDIGEEGDAGHRPVEHHRRGHALQTQRSGEGGGLPVPVRDGRPAALPALRPATPAGHFGRGAGFVDEDQMLWIEIRLGVEPSLPPRGDVGPPPLAGVRGFF
jgi:hypothetical protein